jgi:hypothetical protein
MPVNVALGHVSNAFLIAALVIYSLSVVAFAGDFAFGRPRRAAGARAGARPCRRAGFGGRRERCGCRGRDGRPGPGPGDGG